MDAASLDHPVRARDQRLRNIQAELARGLEVDGELIPAWHFHRQLTGFRPAQDAIDVLDRAPDAGQAMRAVRDKTTKLHPASIEVDCGDALPRGEFDNASAVPKGHHRAENPHRFRTALGDLRKGPVDVLVAMQLDLLQHYVER